MRLRVRFFSNLRQITGQSELSYHFSGRTAGELWNELSRRFPTLTPFTQSRAIAVNLKHTTPDHPLKEGDEVAFFPPVSGG
jgi:molybdopterin converting factor subunit 1